MYNNFNTVDVRSSRSCAITKMAVKGPVLALKHCTTFALFSNGFHQQTEKAHTNKRLLKGRINGDQQKL